jgi:replicative DNA helicase
MISKVASVLVSAKKKLGRYQSGADKPIATGREWLDDIFGGLLPGDIVAIAGSSGGGKSFENQRVKNYVMNLEINPDSKDYIWLDYSMEMRFLSTMLRDIAKITQKSKRKILTESFSEEEKVLLAKYTENLSDGRFYIDEDVKTLAEFKAELIVFLEEHKDKKAIFISIDHIALFKGADKKGTIDDVIEFINEIRKKYPNTYWFVLTQLNRSIEGRIKEKDMIAFPQRSDIFQSDSIFFITDYLYVCHSPYRLGIKEFLRVNAEAYDYLKDHFSEVKNGKASFDTLGKMFFIVLKSRESEPIFNNIFVEDIAVKNKEKYRDKTDEEIVGSGEVPVFNNFNQNTSALRKASGQISNIDLSSFDEVDNAPF